MNKTEYDEKNQVRCKHCGRIAGLHYVNGKLKKAKCSCQRK